MSVQAITWALEQTVGSPTGKVILLCLANYADKHGACFPGHKTIAEECEVSVRSVAEWMNRLEDAGFIVRSRRFRNNGSRTSDSIVLRLPWLEATTSAGPDAESALGDENAEKPASPHADERVDHMQLAHPHTLKGNLKPPNPPEGGLGFASLLKVWPTEDHGNLENAEGAWKRLGTDAQVRALDLAALALTAYRRRKVRIPALKRFLSERMFEEFHDAPPIDADGHFELRPGMPGWNEWMGWVRKKHGQKGVDHIVKGGVFRVPTRYPPADEAAA